MPPNDQHSNSPQVGDVVSWQWAGGHTGGIVTDVEKGETRIKTKNDHTVARHGTETNPAIKIVSDTTGNTVLKKASEVQVEEKFSDPEEENIVSDKKCGEKRSEPNHYDPEEGSSIETVPAKKLRTGNQTTFDDRLEGKGLSKGDKKLVKDHVKEVDEKNLEKKLDDKGLDADDKEIVVDNIHELDEKDMKEPISHRTRNKKGSDAQTDAAVVAEEIFRS